MKKPLLKILPGVAVVLLSPSCSKDNDIIDEDNAALVAEQKIEHKAFYLKINIASSLSKMAVAELGGVGKKDLKFEVGDQMTLSFYIVTQIQLSGSDDDPSPVEDQSVQVEVDILCVDPDGTFAVDPENLKEAVNSIYDLYDSKATYEAAEKALEEMQNGEEDAASNYNVQLWWTSYNSVPTQNSYREYDNLSEMFLNAPRSADKCFTLKQAGEYSFLVIEEGSTKTVKINKNTLDNSKCYIVGPRSEVTVVDGDKTNTITTESGKLYYVRKREGDVSNTLSNPDAGKINTVYF